MLGLRPTKELEPIWCEETTDALDSKKFTADCGPTRGATQIAEIPPLKDNLLGTLEWDDNFNWYRGKIYVADTSFDISLSPHEGTDASTALSRAKQIVRAFENYQTMAAEYAVDCLLDLKNDVWLEDGEEAVSADEFKAKMTLEALTIEADGSVTFWHHDGDLFWGHSIEVCVDSNDQCTSADIPG